jgi:hypothetical protein
MICGGAHICGNSRVKGKAKVCGIAVVDGNAVVDDNAQIWGSAEVSGNAQVFGDSKCSKTPVSLTTSEYNLTVTDNLIHVGGQTLSYKDLPPKLQEVIRVLVPDLPIVDFSGKSALERISEGAV